MGKHKKPHYRRKRSGGGYRTGLRKNYIAALHGGYLTPSDTYEAYALGVISRREYVRICRKKHWKVK